MRTISDAGLVRAQRAPSALSCQVEFILLCKVGTDPGTSDLGPAHSFAPFSQERETVCPVAGAGLPQAAGGSDPSPQRHGVCGHSRPFPHVPGQGTSGGPGAPVLPACPPAATSALCGPQRAWAKLGQAATSWPPEPRHRAFMTVMWGWVGETCELCLWGRDRGWEAGQQGAGPNPQQPPCSW